MNAQHFNHIISEPAIIKDVMKDDIASLLKQYPYCQSLHLIHQKKLHLEQHPDFNTYLARTAAYANDRKALYRLIYTTAEEQITESGNTIRQEEETTRGTLVGLQSETAAEYTPKNAMAELDNYENIDFE